MMADVPLACWVLLYATKQEHSKITSRRKCNADWHLRIILLPGPCQTLPPSSAGLFAISFVSDRLWVLPRSWSCPVSASASCTSKMEGKRQKVGSTWRLFLFSEGILEKPLAFRFRDPQIKAWVKNSKFPTVALHCTSFKHSTFQKEVPLVPLPSSNLSINIKDQIALLQRTAATL